LGAAAGCCPSLGAASTFSPLVQTTLTLPKYVFADLDSLSSFD